MKRVLTIIGAAGCAFGAHAQSLFLERPAAPGALEQDERAASEPLYAYSFVAVRPPEPREFLPNDLVTILVRETTTVKRDQTLETEKEHQLELQLIRIKALEKFLTLAGDDVAGTVGAQPMFDINSEFEGEGEYERNDDVMARLTARVLEVKPNGTLLLEARTSVRTDEEVQTITLSGLCRGQDVTEQNTVQSSDLYDLRLDVQNEGEIRDASKKGLIPKLVESVFGG